MRHVSTSQKQDIVKFFFGDIQHSLREGKKLPGTDVFFVRISTAFEEAFSIHGCSCDVCSAVVEIEEDKCRYTADRALSNLDGIVKLMLCTQCNKRYSSFCSRTFQREARVPFSRDLEQMMLAFIATVVGTEARRIAAGRPPWKRRHEQNLKRDGGVDRAAIAPGINLAGNMSIDWSTQKNCQKISR